MTTKAELTKQLAKLERENKKLRNRVAELELAIAPPGSKPPAKPHVTPPPPAFPWEQSQ